MAEQVFVPLRYRLTDDDDPAIVVSDYQEVSELAGLPVRVLDDSGNVVNISNAWNYANLAAQSTLALRSGPGILHGILFNTPVATSVITIWDGTVAAAPATLMGTITLPTAPMMVWFPYDAIFSRGLVVKQATASSDLTVLYR